MTVWPGAEGIAGGVLLFAQQSSTCSRSPNFASTPRRAARTGAAALGAGPNSHLWSLLR